MKSVDKKFERRSRVMVHTSSLLNETSLAATRVRIENTRKASLTDRVPSAEPLRTR